MPLASATVEILRLWSAASAASRDPVKLIARTFVHESKPKARVSPAFVGREKVVPSGADANPILTRSVPAKPVPIPKPETAWFAVLDCRLSREGTLMVLFSPGLLSAVPRMRSDPTSRRPAASVVRLNTAPRSAPVSDTATPAPFLTLTVNGPWTAFPCSSTTLIWSVTPRSLNKVPAGARTEAAAGSIRSRRRDAPVSAAVGVLSVAVLDAGVSPKERAVMR